MVLSGSVTASQRCNPMMHRKGHFTRHSTGTPHTLVDLRSAIVPEPSEQRRDHVAVPPPVQQGM
jgi:hypothetical protein